MNEEIRELSKEIQELRKQIDELTIYQIHCTNIIQDIMDELRDLSTDTSNISRMDKYITENM